MITKQNYFDKVGSIDYNSLPEALKEGFDTVKFGSKDYTTWEYLEDDPEFLNLYFNKLNIFIGTESYEKEHNIPKTKDKSENIKENEIVKTVPKKIRIKPVSTAKANKVKTGLKPVSTKKTEKVVEKVSVGVEHLSEEIKFIRKYVALHEKVKSKPQILTMLNSLQKAIVEKRIRKTSPYSSEILHIQNQLIKLHNSMKTDAKVELNKSTFEKYKLISSSQHILTSINFIKRYLSLHGKEDVRDKVAILIKQMRNAVQQKKLLESDPYSKALNKIFLSLNEYQSNAKKKSPEIHPSELNGFAALLPFSTAVLNKKKVNANIKSDIKLNLSGIEKTSPEVISSSELSHMKFDTIGLEGKFNELIGDPSQGFTCMVFGKPKSGKSTLCIDFAKHLAAHHGKVLYTAIEEGYGYTLKEKVERLNAIHPNLFISETIPANVGKFDFVFIDSVSKGKIDNDMLNQLHQKNPKTAFIFIFHSTKDGDFRGGQQNAHDVDCIIEVKDGVAYGKGRFGIGGEMNVFE